MKPKIYFGRPINVYNTELEVLLVKKVAAAFPDWDIENPNQPRHQEGYRRWKETTGKGMDYYFQEVLPGCSAGIFLPFRDGCWGAGIVGETECLAERGCPIYQITQDGVITKVNLDEIRGLTIEETITRIRTKTDETVPY